MKNYGIVVHGGAGPDSDFIKTNLTGFAEGLKDAVIAGDEVLKKGGKAVDAVAKAVESMENNLLFNSGRGSALNCLGQIEMDSSIMDGKNLKSGAVSMVTKVKNPVKLAKFIMENSNHVFLSGDGALKFAEDENLELEPDSYFITDHQVKEFLKERDKKDVQEEMKKRVHGTVGAVALDKKGNLASATSTGGTCNCLDGRIGDSCIIGAGCYAENENCALSGTGDGEKLVNYVLAHTIAMQVKLAGMSLQEACNYVINILHKDEKEDLGIIGIDPLGNIGIAFNTERLHRAWKINDEEPVIKIYKK